MGASQRQKGQRGEREVAAILGPLIGCDLVRNLDQTRDGGRDLLGVQGWSIEVKRCESLSRPTWWRQAVEQAKAVGCEPMLFYRRNREPWTAWIHAGDGKHREGTMQDAANAINDKLSRWP